MARVYARIWSNTGTPPEEVAAMPLRRVLGLLYHWDERPPMAELAAAFLGARTETGGPDLLPRKKMTDAEAAAFKAMMDG